MSQGDPPSFQRAGRRTTAGGSGRRRGAPGACHQPLCGRMRELGFTIESHSVDAFEDLQAALLGFAACCERLLARYSPAFLGCVAADAAGPDSNLETLRPVFNDIATHAKITDHPGTHVELSPQFIDDNNRLWRIGAYCASKMRPFFTFVQLLTSKAGE
nr:hypothetical protein [Bordetella petrii]